MRPYSRPNPRLFQKVLYFVENPWAHLSNMEVHSPGSPMCTSAIRVESYRSFTVEKTCYILPSKSTIHGLIIHLEACCEVC